MSSIIQPSQGILSPQAIDYQENAISRQSPNITTSSLSLVTLYSVVIPGRTLDSDGKRVEFFVTGNLTGTLGTKRIVALLDGTSIHDSTALTLNSSNYTLRIVLARLLTTNLHCASLFFTNLFGAPTITNSQQLVTQINSIDLTQDHTFAVQGAVGNAGDNVSVIIGYGGVR